jgi:hypothetical protein
MSLVALISFINFLTLSHILMQPSVPIFLYTDVVVYFLSLTEAEFRRLELVFNACTRYVYRHCDHNSEFSRENLGCRLFEYLELRLAGFIHKIVIVGTPVYLSSRLVLGRFPRNRLLVIPNPVPVTSQRSTVVFVYGMCCLLPPSSL